MTAKSKHTGSDRIARAPFGSALANANAGMHRMSAGRRRLSPLKRSCKTRGASLKGLRPPRSLKSN